MNSEAKRYANQDLGDGYSTLGVVGAGMFAWVYEGRDADDQRVAIKILHRQEGQAAQRFAREIKVYQELPPNQHCVGYRGHGETPDGALFLALEYVDGVSLKQLFKSNKRLKEQAACKLMHQLCEGFAGLHKLGLAHRDIKPDNIMISRADRQVKLMDFGLVHDSQGLLRLFEEHDILEGRDFADDIDHGMVAGTPEYMAPEQISDPQVDHRLKRTDTTADIYSLGVIFYQLLTGKKLFPADIKGRGPDAQRKLMDYLVQRLNQTDDDIVRPPTIGEALWSIIRKALRRDPKLRQGDARQLAGDIARYIKTGEGIPEDEDIAKTQAVEMVPEIRDLLTKLGEQEYPEQRPWEPKDKPKDDAEPPALEASTDPEVAVGAPTAPPTLSPPPAAEAEAPAPLPEPPASDELAPDLAEADQAEPGSTIKGVGPKAVQAQAEAVAPSAIDTEPAAPPGPAPPPDMVAPRTPTSETVAPRTPTSETAAPQAPQPAPAPAPAPATAPHVVAPQAARPAAEQPQSDVLWTIAWAMAGALVAGGVIFLLWVLKVF